MLWSLSPSLSLYLFSSGPSLFFVNYLKFYIRFCAKCSTFTILLLMSNCSRYLIIRSELRLDRRWKRVSTFVTTIFMALGKCIIVNVTMFRMCNLNFFVLSETSTSHSSLWFSVKRKTKNRPNDKLLNHKNVNISI